MILRNPDHSFVTDDYANIQAAPVAADVRFSVSDDTDRGSLSVYVSAPRGTAVSKIVLRWRSDMSTPLRILGDQVERGYGDLEWRGVVAERFMPWYALAHEVETGRTHGFGVQTGGSAFAFWQIDEAGVTLTLDVRCGGMGVLLEGRELHVATIRYRESLGGESAFESASAFCRMLCANPRLPKFPVYGGNDWYYAYGNNSESSILRDAANMRDLSLNRENAPFMVIDAGWFPERGCNGGPYDRGNDRFPDLAALADRMHRMEVRPGIWIRPLLNCAMPESWKLPENHPIHQQGQGGVFADPSRPEVLAWVAEDIRRLREWGYVLIKHDFTTFDCTGRWGFEMDGGQITSGDWSFADRSRTTAEILCDLYRTIREAADDAILIGCNTVGHLGAGYHELQRTGDDTSGREWERTRKMGINTLAFRMPQHRAFFAADADCVGLTDSVPWSLNRQWLELLAASGTPLFVSADPAALGIDQRQALTEAFRLAATPLPSAEPLDWMHTSCPRVWRLRGERRTFEWHDRK